MFFVGRASGMAYLEICPLAHPRELKGEHDSRLGGRTSRSGTMPRLCGARNGLGHDRAQLRARRRVEGHRTLKPDHLDGVAFAVRAQSASSLVAPLCRKRADATTVANLCQETSLRDALCQRTSAVVRGATVASRATRSLSNTSPARARWEGPATARTWEAPPGLRRTRWFWICRQIVTSWSLPAGRACAASRQTGSTIRFVRGCRCAEPRKACPIGLGDQDPSSWSCLNLSRLSLRTLRARDG